jgi:hypothetical protein
MVVFVIPFMYEQIGPDLYLKAQIEIKSVQKGLRLFGLQVTRLEILELILQQQSKISSSTCSIQF